MSSGAQPAQVPYGANPPIVWNGQRNSPDVLFWNQDLNSTAFLGFTPNISPNGLNTIPVPPYAAFTLPGDRTVYAVPGSPNMASLVVLPGGGNFFSL